MKSEYEVTILDIDKDQLEKNLINKGAKKIGNYFQKRYTYQFNDTSENKWIRLRTNGEIATLTIKKILKSGAIGGTNELEIVVDNFDKTDLLLNELGFYHNRYEENKRIQYKYNDIEIDIDKWPMIPWYVEIEGPSEEKVIAFAENLNLNKEKYTAIGVNKIYLKYGIDLDQYQELILKED